MGVGSVRSAGAGVAALPVMAVSRSHFAFRRAADESVIAFAPWCAIPEEIN